MEWKYKSIKGEKKKTKKEEEAKEEKKRKNEGEEKEENQEVNEGEEEGGEEKLGIWSLLFSGAGKV